MLLSSPQDSATNTIHAYTFIHSRPKQRPIFGSLLRSGSDFKKIRTRGKVQRVPHDRKMPLVPCTRALVRERERPSGDFQGTVVVVYCTVSETSWNTPTTWWSAPKIPRASRVRAAASERYSPKRRSRRGGGSPGRVGHVGCDNARSAAMSVSLRRCTVAATYPGGAFVGCVSVSAVLPLHRFPQHRSMQRKAWKRDCRIRA